MASVRSRPRSQEIKAKYSGSCDECGEPFGRGAPIVWDPETGETVHKKCPSDAPFADTDHIRMDDYFKSSRYRSAVRRHSDFDSVDPDEKEVGVLIRFSEDVSMEDVEKILRDLDSKGLLKEAEGAKYCPGIGRPRFYIP